MIGSLRGSVARCTLRNDHVGELLVEAGAVGYRVVTTAPGAAAMSTLGAEVYLQVHTHVREDAIVLYGFATCEERDAFEVLITAHGVGPSVALALLAVHSPRALRRAVEADDLEALMLVPGIGRKTAARLVIELKARLDPDVSSALTSGPGSQVDGAPDNEAVLRREVRAALESLGYGPEEIRSVILRLEPGSVEDQLRAALRELALFR